MSVFRHLIYRYVNFYSDNNNSSSISTNKPIYLRGYTPTIVSLKDTKTVKN